MASYNNIRKRMIGRIKVFIGILVFFAFIFLAFGISGTSGGSEPGFVKAAEEAAAAEGRTVSAEERAQMEMLDRSTAKSGRQTGIVMIILGVLCCGGIALVWNSSSVEKSKLAKMAALYTMHLGEKNPEKALQELNSELADPVYNSAQLTLTKNWLVGHVGTTRKAVAFPVASIVGVYYYSLVRHSGSSTGRFYQILINDKYDKSWVLQLKDKKQLDNAYQAVTAACSNAHTGGYEEDYQDSYCVKSQKEREKQITEILQANEAAGMVYCER